MSQIWYAAFSEDFVEQAQKIFKKLDKDVIVTVWDPELVPEMLRRGVSVILGRGATALRIRKVVDLPVVEIPIPFEDMADTLIEASSYGRNIGVIGYNNLLSGLERLNPILNVSIRQIFAVDEDDTYHQIQKLKNEGVDVIVGTRGETEEYFGQAYEFIESLDVTQLHVFSYSERPGTQALKIDHVVAPEEKHRRSQQLLELSDEKTRAFYARHIGQTMPVLLERPKPGLPMHGFTPNYIRVEVPHDAALDNQLVSVRLGDFNADGTALLGAME